MDRREQTTQGSLESLRESSPEERVAPEPGLLLVFSAGRPACIAVPVGSEAGEIGRGRGALAEVLDPTLSRQHARVAYVDGEFRITDLESRNGTAINGEPLRGSARASVGGVLRLGHSLFLLCDDLRPYRLYKVSRQGERVEGPAMRRAMLAIAKAAQVSRTLFITGESGTGKELLAQAFHRAGPQRDGPFVAVNCATMIDGVAELQAAVGGTIFLDEVANLDVGVQAKLLRALETGAVSDASVLGPRPPRVCCATHRDLRRLVADGYFRADLFFRIGVPQIDVPPLRQRLAELPWHIIAAVERTGVELGVHSALIESCLLRPWPGNIRELQAEVSTAVIAALADGDGTLGVRHLSARAGVALAVDVSATNPAEPAAAEPITVYDSGVEETDPEEEDAAELARVPTRAQVLAAVQATHGNVSAAARMLGLHRTQLRRRLHQYGWATKKLD